MRPPARNQSALEAPLNEVLATPGAVRVLRLLTRAVGARTEDSPAVADLGRDAGLTQAGARRVIARLVQLGVVESWQNGGQRVRLRQTHPLAAPLQALFGAERDLATRRWQALIACFETMAPPPMAAWVEGAAASDDAQAGQAIAIGVLVPTTPALDVWKRMIEPALAEVGTQHAATFVPSVHTPGEFAALPDTGQWRHVRSIMGPPPVTWRPRTGIIHATLPALTVSGAVTVTVTTPSDRVAQKDPTARAAALARAVAVKGDRDHTVIATAAAFLARRLQQAAEGERAELESWAQLLRLGDWAQIRQVLLGQDEHAQRLRQSFPFVGVLTAQERAMALAGAGFTP